MYRVEPSYFAPPIRNIVGWTPFRYLIVNIVYPLFFWDVKQILYTSQTGSHVHCRAMKQNTVCAFNESFIQRKYNRDHTGLNGH